MKSDSAGNPPDRWRVRPGLVALIATLALGLGACKESLHSNLTEQEANEIVVVLAQSGLAADKVRTDDETWAIEVDHSDLPFAVEGLRRAGLPRQRYSNLGEMFKREGIVSTPTEERVRFLHGVSQELSNTLSTIDGVVAARVHIVIPQNDPLSDRTLPSSASVFLKHHAGLDLQPMLPSIKSLVLRSVEGLTYDTVYVSLFPSAPVPTDRLATPVEPLLGIQLPSGQARWLNPLLLVLVLLPIFGLLYLVYLNRTALREARDQVAHLQRSNLARRDGFGAADPALRSPADFSDSRIAANSGD